MFRSAAVSFICKDTIKEAMCAATVNRNYEKRYILAGRHTNLVNYLGHFLAIADESTPAEDMCADTLD